MKPGPAAELRRATRYHLRIPIQVSYEPSGGRKTFVAMTRDISIAGLFVTSAEDLAAHTQVDVSVTLKPAAAIQLTGSGRVVRRSEATEEVGFAIAVRLDWPN